MKEILEQLGIEKTLLIGGLVGSILGINGGDKKTVISRIFAVISGVSLAVYLSPLASELFEIQNEKSKIGISVLIGYLGISGIQKLILKKIDLKIEKDGNS